MNGEEKSFLFKKRRESLNFDCLIEMVYIIIEISTWLQSFEIIKTYQLK